jgi:hypothetical protein
MGTLASGSLFFLKICSAIFLQKHKFINMKKHLLFYIFLFLNSFSISNQTKNKITDSLLLEMTDSIFSKHYPAVHFRIPALLLNQ